VYVATAAELEGVSGRFFANEREARTSEASYDPDLAKRLWEVSATLVGLHTTSLRQVENELDTARRPRR
jgi:hypothetical protein